MVFRASISVSRRSEDFKEKPYIEYAVINLKVLMVITRNKHCTTIKGWSLKRVSVRNRSDWRRFHSHSWVSIS